MLFVHNFAAITFRCYSVGTFGGVQLSCSLYSATQFLVLLEALNGTETGALLTKGWSRPPKRIKILF